MQQHSENYGQIMRARIKVQTEVMKGAKRDRLNPFAKSKYATLESVLESICEPLTDAGLVITQGSEAIRERGVDKTLSRWLTVWTRLDHAESGEWIQVSTEVPIEKATPQAIGSALTYGRRYTVKLLLGMPEIDDDGQAAAGEKSPLVQKSSAEAKRDGTDKVFNEIQSSIQNALDIDHLRQIPDLYRDEIDQMPTKWRDLLKDEFETKRLGLTS
jgi:hypothetical protein